MDSFVANALILHISENHAIHFTKVVQDLYVFDASNVNLSKLRESFSFLTTVSNNKSMFKPRDIQKAEKAVELSRRVNHLANDKMIRVVQKGLIRNCPVTVGDIWRSHIIYGPPIPALKGRTKYRESDRVQEKEIIQLPQELYEDLKHVTLCADFNYVSGINVLHTILRQIKYWTVSFPLNRSKQTMINAIRDVQQIYHNRGFRIVDLHTDNEFAQVENKIGSIQLQCCGMDEHVPEIERSIQLKQY